MKNELKELAENYPSKVKWAEIIEFDTFDERHSAIGVIVTNTIDVTKKNIKFCPENNPPSNEEILTWIWSFRPDLSDQLLDFDLSENFRLLVMSFKTNKMDEFWNKLCDWSAPEAKELSENLAYFKKNIAPSK